MEAQRSRWPGDVRHSGVAMEIAFIPSILTRRLSNDGVRRFDLNVLISCCSILIALILLGLFPSAMDYLPINCIFRQTLGLPCPGCGVLSGSAALLSGNVHAALVANPACFVVVPLLVVQVPIRLQLLGQHNTCRRNIDGLSRSANLLAVLVILLVWLGRAISVGSSG